MPSDQFEGEFVEADDQRWQRFVRISRYVDLAWKLIEQRRAEHAASKGEREAA